MRNFVMIFQIVILFVINVLINRTTNAAINMLNVYMHFKLVFIKEMSITKFTEGMEESNVVAFIYISSLQMFCKSLIRI